MIGLTYFRSQTGEPYFPIYTRPMRIGQTEPVRITPYFAREARQGVDRIGICKP